MTDVHSPEIRSYNMSRIRSKNTKPELLVRHFLYYSGLRYRVHHKGLPGKPDIVLPKYKTVVFINGCFWHGHEECKYFTMPKTRSEYWLNKIYNNINKDRKHVLTLEQIGWKVIVVWECDLKPNKAQITLSKLLKQIKSVRI